MKNYLGYVTVEPVLFLYMMLIFIETSGLQGIIFVKVCLEMNHPNDTNECSKKNETAHHNDVIHSATMWYKYCGACLFFCTLAVSFYVGSWSDYFGRKLPMLIPPVGSLVAAAINTTLAVFLEAHVGFFLISSVISGLTFGTVGMIACTFGYISDVVPEESRTKRIVILEAMIFTGGTLGSSLAAFILKNNDLHVLLSKYVEVFILEMTLALCIIFYIIFRIPGGNPRSVEDSDDMHRRSCVQLFNLSHVKNLFYTVFRPREGKKRHHMMMLLVAITMLYYCSAVQFSVAFYFTKGKPLLWDITKYSFYNAIQFAVEGVALLIGLPISLHYLHVPDTFVAILGTISRMSGLILFGLSYNDYMVYSCAAVYILSEFPIPAVRSMLSKIVEKDERGKIFAFTTILQNVCYFTGTLILNSIFEASSFFPGLVFQIVAFLQVIALVIFCYLHVTRERVVALYEIIDSESAEKF